MRLVLASGSPRRRALLGELGYEVSYTSLNVDEHLSSPLPAAQVAEHLACRKAAAFPIDTLDEDSVLVTADTVVVLDGRILGKPADRDEATQMLHSLSGRSHTVYTGVCLRSRQQQTAFTESTEVHFRQLEDTEIAYYIDHYHPFDKAGAYGIQEWIGMVGIERIEGCFYNVMGLPVSRLYRTLRERFESR